MLTILNFFRRTDAAKHQTVCNPTVARVFVRSTSRLSAAQGYCRRIWETTGLRLFPCDLLAFTVRKPDNHDTKKNGCPFFASSRCLVTCAALKTFRGLCPLLCSALVGRGLGTSALLTDAVLLGRCPKPHKGRCPLTLQGSSTLDPFRDGVERFCIQVARAALVACTALKTFRELCPLLCSALVRAGLGTSALLIDAVLLGRCPKPCKGQKTGRSPP